MTLNSQVDILLVEDSPSDAQLVIEAFDEQRVNCRIHCVTNGEDALNFLRKKGSWANSPRPDLIFLDLNLPRKDGREVLSEIKNDEHLKVIPVIVMTTSSARLDVLKCYTLQACSYIVKPLDVNQFFELMRILSDYWLRVVTLPFNNKECGLISKDTFV